MTDHPPTDYYARRAAQERAAAERTQDDGVRNVHLELARRYAAMTPATVG